MSDLIALQELDSTLEAIQAWLLANVLTVSTLVQIAVVGLLFIVARFIAPRLRAGLERQGQRYRLEARLRQIASVLAPLTLSLVWLLLQWTALLVAEQAGWPHKVITVAVSLLTAWVIISMTSNLVRDPVWSQVVAVIAWSIAALNILGLLDATTVLLDSVALSLGGLRISALTVIKVGLTLAVLLWLATLISRILEQRINTLPNLTPSVQVLFGKLLKMLLITVAILAALSSVGIDLTAFAVFGGAIGVGLGFGLQKVVSNLISGVILLLDKSIKPGDVIGVAGTYGWINSLGARYVSVVTRDRIEHLIPNEELITQRVENWSFSNNIVRLRVPVGVAYNSDLRQVMALCLEATEESPRVLSEPKSVCLLKGFGDSSVDFELRIFINDPRNGTANVKSDVLLRIWDKFQANGIEIPFPQRDLHIKSSAVDLKPNGRTETGPGQGA